MPVSSNSPDNAGVIAPAPVFFAVTFILGLSAQYFYSMPIAQTGYTRIAGLVFIVISIPIVLSAVYELRKAGTAFDARKASTALVTSGIFRFSRNPTYLSMTILFSGFALVLNSIWLLLAVAVALVCTQIGVIQREEHYMAAKFGDEFYRYKDQVRRWI